MSPDRITAAQYQEMMAKRKLVASGAPGSAWRGKVAKPGEAFGLKFPSQVQLRTYQQLKYMYPKAMIVREPILDLWTLAVNGKPGRYRPDFMVIEEVEGAHANGDWFPKHLEVSIHEAKGSKGAESRDWRVRAAAAINEYPFIPMYVWRATGKTVYRVPIQELFRS
mgnify:CR=1 FL=1